jgi:tetratricopeptide (TPR) repeat protein
LCYLNLGKNSQAEKEFAKIFQITPEDADSLSVISTAYKENKNLSKSKEYIERAIALDKENIKLRLKYAEILELMQEDENALREFDFIIAKDPDNPQAYFGLGLFHLNRKNLEKGISYLEKSLALSPSPVVYFTLGLAYRIAGREKEALESLEKYLEVAPTAEKDRIKIAQQVIASLKK